MNKHKKSIAFFLLLIFTLPMGSGRLLALTSGTSILGFSGFSLLGTNEMGDPFISEYSYNVPRFELSEPYGVDTLINVTAPSAGQGNVLPMENEESIEMQLTPEQKQELAVIEQMQAEKIQQVKLELEQRKQAELLSIHSGMGKTANQGAESQTMMSAGLPTQAEYDALMDLYQATNGANWTNNTGWSSANPNVIQDVSGFYGVHTNASGNVTGIFMSNNKLLGEIPESIGNLAHLEYLDLSVNNLYKYIPQSIGNLVNLKLLYLNSCVINWSTIPESIVNLTNLEQLALHSNYLTGPIPADIGNLTKLKVLALFFTKLEGNLPSSIGNLHDMEWLELMGANFSGPIPSSFSNLTKLYHFRVYDNQLTGPVPDYFCSFPNLLILNLQNNQFTGTLPTCIYTSGINHVFLANNNFSIESLIDMAPHFPDQSYFLPQKASTDTVYVSVAEGDFLVLTTDLGINAPGVTEYRWVNDGVPLFPDFQQNAFEFTDTSFSCQYYPEGSSGPNSCNGVYQVEIQNSLLPAGTVIKGPPVVVETIPETLNMTICLME
ncbi:leucine-rich repeat domain-containing protein [Algoriphagus sp.]|uniref:leucine-rich repeat domain-containing protein n=1 Tax=Algoriphagus sp. TaxID=1872435 RepID=UPI003F712F05